MDATNPLPASPGPAGAEPALQELLGYLNFSGGRHDPRFFRNLNAVASAVGLSQLWTGLGKVLQEGLRQCAATNPAFANCAQGSAVLRIVFEGLARAYREHHADLFFHLDERDWEAPFLLGRMFEAVLQQGGPWSETDRIIAGSLHDLNDFLGHRPVAVLENGRKMEPYDHERFRPVPLYIAGAGVAAGRYRTLIERALDQLQKTPGDLLAESHFHLDQLDELALDPRAYDNQHPVYKRTNYMFGEWDPHLLDNQGRYRRFVLRMIVLEALEDWMQHVSHLPPEEMLFEAGAVLCGTMLMASTISGSGPHTYDSHASLGALLPQVARRRDAFYSRLLESLEGPLGERLRKEALAAKQPFGLVRQHLNLYVANYSSRQLQHGSLALMYARMGYAESARKQAAVIPSLSVRFETEIAWRITAAHRLLDRDDLQGAVQIVPELENLLQRGIVCGALVDPWNILGFQGNFPLFQAREDAVVDPRVEKLLDQVEQIFVLCGRILSEAAAVGQTAAGETVRNRFRALVEQLDRYATTTVSGLPAVSGAESLNSACNVAEVLARWHAAGDAAGDMGFWKKHLAGFETVKAYALVLDVLFRKRDHVAAMGLLIQWLSQADTVGLESGPYAFDQSVLRWVNILLGLADPPGPGDAPADVPRIWNTLVRFSDYLEANAGEYWHVPSLKSLLDSLADGGGPLRLDDEAGDEEEDEEEARGDEEDLFSAAYENVIFRESGRDGRHGDTVEPGGPEAEPETDLDLLSRQIDTRLRFQSAVARIWQMAAEYVAQVAHQRGTTPGEFYGPGGRATLQRWHARLADVQRGLLQLLKALSRLEIPEPSGEHDAMVEFDRQLGLKFSLLNSVTMAYVTCHEAAWAVAGELPEAEAAPKLPAWEQRALELYRAVRRGDIKEARTVVPALLAALQKLPLLYVPLDKGGDPQQMLATRTLHAVIRLLIVQLPRLGLYRETYQFLRTAQQMERNAPPAGTVITEFDRLFDLAFRSALDSLVQQSRAWSATDSPAEDLVDLAGELTQHFLNLWLDHSATMRLSSVELLADPREWRRVKDFIARYGQDFCHATLLTFGNVRAILHHGVVPYLHYLEEHEDPLHPIRLLQDLARGQADLEKSARVLELVFRIIVEKYDRYLEYNTTTVQSDYGEQFYSLLDFLRVEADYERQAWNLRPLVLAHQVLVRSGQRAAADAWFQIFESRTAEVAEVLVKQLRKLEKQYGIRLPSISDLVQERFVKPLTLDRILAHVSTAIDDIRNGRDSPAFRELERDVEAYLESSLGSGLDVPNWLRDLDDEIAAHDPLILANRAHEQEAFLVPLQPLTRAELDRQLEQLEQPPRKPPKKKR